MILNRVFKLIFVLGLFIGISNNSLAVNYFAIANGNWTDPSIWSLTINGAGGAGVPGIGDVAITNGRQVGIDPLLDGDIIVDRVTVTGNVANSIFYSDAFFTFIPVTLTIRLSLSSTPQTTQSIDNSPFLNIVLQGTGPAVLNNWSVNSPFGSLTFDSGGTTTIGSNFAISGTLTIASGTTLTLNAINSISDASGSASLQVQSGATFNLNGVVHGGSNLTRFSTVDINGTCNIGTSGYLNSVGFSLGSSGVLNVNFQGADQTQGWWYQNISPSSASVNPISTITYNANTSQTVVASGFTYGNLALTSSSSTVKTLSGSGLQIAGNLTVGANVTTTPTSQVDFVGTADQSISGGGTLNFDGGLEVNKSSGILSFEKNLSINSGLILTQGTLDLGDVTTTLAGGNVNNLGTITSGSIGTLNVTGTSSFGGSGIYQLNGTLNVTGTSAFGISSTLTINNLTTGPSGSVTINNPNWSLTGNLTNNGSFILPSTSTVNFTGGAAQTISGNSFSIGNMVVNKTSSTLSNDGGINLLGLLTMTTGTFDADGAGSGVLTLVSDSNADGRIGSMAGGSIQGEVTFQRYYDNTTSNRWRNFGFPVGDVTYSELGSSIVLQPNSLARYNELASGNVDQGWIFVNSGTLSTQFGHTAWMYNTTPTTVSVRGPLVKQTNAPYNYLVTYFNDPAQPASEDGWNLVPNPYASPIDWDNPGWVKTNVNSVIAVWNNATGIYNYTTGGPNSLWDGVIAAGQSFWVQTNAINPVLTSSESVKVNVSDPEFYRKKNEPIRWLLAVGLKSLDNYDQTYIRFSTEATPEFDGSFDAYKLKNSIYNLSTLTNEGLNLAVNVLPKASCTSSIRLNITNAEPGSYTMNFEGLDSFENVNSVTLVDKMLDKKLVLNKETVYEFEITANSRTYGAERFELVFDFGDEVIQPQITQEEIQLVSSSDKGNQWYFNNEIVEGATGKYFTPSAPGNYHVVVSDGVCDLQSASLYVSEGYSRVYPNPATEVLKVDVRNALESNQQGEIRIHSLQGQLMHTEPFTSHDRVKEILVNQFAAGMYVLTITNENGVVIEKTKVIRK